MTVTPQFQRASARADYERTCNSVRTMLNSSASGEVVRAFAHLEDELDTGVHTVKPALLGSALSWNPDDRGLSEWIYTQHYELAELARRAADVFERRDGFASANTLRMMGLAFMHWGEAAKWVVGRRERFAYGWMHWLMGMALEEGCIRHVCEVRLDGRMRPATLEFLFLRTLILDRFAGGNLSRPQCEILDAWLWEWMPQVAATTVWPGEAAFRADLDGKGGLRHGKRDNLGPVLYLAVAPLEGRRREVIKEFHRGRIVPALGIASDFRVEEHVAVLDHLGVAFASVHEQEVEREVRHPVAGNPVEVCVGLAEILMRGIGADGTGNSPAGLAASKAALSDTQRLRRAEFADELAATRRSLRLVDVSGAGYGFDATESEAANIAIDDLVSIRLGRDEACVLGRVTRRIPASVAGHVMIGVRTISDYPKILTLSRSTPRGRSDDEEAFIYVAGMDASGSQDSFLIPDKVLNDPVSREAVIAGQQFTIRFNRVRRKGRGWALVGFEILAARPAAPGG